MPIHYEEQLSMTDLCQVTVDTKQAFVMTAWLIIGGVGLSP
jgi:hypothetical protein